MAIASQAKHFVSTPLVQTIVNDVYLGKIAFSNVATPRSVLADNYKQKAIEVYDHRNAPFLDHYRWVGPSRKAGKWLKWNSFRLRVPKYCAILEFLNFAALLVAFVLCVSSVYSRICRLSCTIRHADWLFTDAEANYMTAYEIFFIIFAVSFALEEYTASREHGWDSKSRNLWEFWDSSCHPI